MIDKPEKIIYVGLNYRSHAIESNMDIIEVPALFSKFNNSLAGHNEIIHLLFNAEKYDYEAELVIVIGKQAKNISCEDSLSYVYGYSVGNDLSARDLQLRTSQWFLGKSLDQFAPVGPYIVTADEVNPDNLDIQCKVNGKLCQAANTRDMVFDCTHLVSYISQYMTLKPGDMIFTGTPPGIILGYPDNKNKWLKSGDEVTIENLGTLHNRLS